MRIHVRADVEVATLTFEAVLPDREEVVDVARLQMSLDHVKRMADVLKRTIDKGTSPKGTS